MNEITPLTYIIYALGVFTAYFYHRLIFANYMENRGYPGNDSFARGLALFFSLASWAMVICITFNAIISGSFTKDK